MSFTKQRVSGCTEERNHLEQHKDPYVMEDRAPLSRDGSSHRNPPERCPRPLYSQDSTQEHQEIPQDDQGEHRKIIKAEVKVEAEELSDELYKAEVGGPSEISLDGCPHSIDPLDSSEEHCMAIQDDQDKNLIYIKVKVKEEAEDMYNMEDETCKQEEDLPPEIDTDGQYRRYNIPKHPNISSDGAMEDDDSLNQSPPKNTDGEKNYSCSDCGKRFSVRSSLTKHQKTHTGLKPFPCSECGKCFTLNSTLIRHQKLHTGEKPFICSECGKGFTQRSGLTSHQRTHTGEKPFACSECEKSFSHRLGLVAHQRIHTGIKPFICTECGKYFTRKESLHFHLRSHTGEKPYSCSICGKCFTGKGGLLSHGRLHTGDNPFFCEDCGKRFAKRKDFVEHQRIHTGEKPFSCSICAKCFSRKSSLIRHKTIHLEEKPYSCSECGKQFCHKFHFKSHLLSHNRQKGLASGSGS